MTVDMLDELATRRLRIQCDLDARKSPAERNLTGQFTTPPQLAREIVRYARQVAPALERLHVADPAVGTGAFLSAVLQTYPRDRIGSLTGIEIDPAFARAAGELWAPAGVEIITGDFTDRTVPERAGHRPNLIISNPPYVRHHHLSREQKQRLSASARDATGLEVNGLAGLYVYFLLLAHPWMTDGGAGVWLIPSEFMSVAYGQVVRRYLAERVTLRTIHRFDPSDVQFADALVSSAVVVFEKTPPEPAGSVRFTFGGTPADPVRSEDVPLERLRRSPKWTHYPHAVTDRARALPDVDHPTLGQLFRIQRGIATGANRFFIMPRDEAVARDLPAQFLRPILPSPRAVRERVIEADAGGFPLLDPVLVLLDCAVPEAEVRASHPALWRYLESGRQGGLTDRYLMQQRRPWYRQEQRQAAPFLCTYMGRGADGDSPFRFFWNRSRAIAPNVWLMLQPVGPLAVALRQRPELAETVFRLLSAITARDLTDEGRVYGGGLHKLEPKELGRISARPLIDAGIIASPPRQVALAL